MKSELAPGASTAPHPLYELLLEKHSGHAGHRPVPTQVSDLQRCPACRGRFVAPGQVYSVMSEDQILLDLECAACGWSNTEIHGDAELQLLEEGLDAAFADLLHTLRAVADANAVEDLERFTAALAADVILPEDF